MGEYLARWSAKTRESLRYTRNRLSRTGDLRFVELDASEGYDLLRELHMKQWTPGADDQLGASRRRRPDRQDS